MPERKNPGRGAPRELFTPNLILPEQSSSARPTQPEKRLLFAILEDACDVCIKWCTAMSHREKRLFQDAYDWIQSDDRFYFGSFLKICEELDLEPDYIRRGVTNTIVRLQTRQAREEEKNVS